MPEGTGEIFRRYSIAVSSAAAVFCLTMLLTNFVQADVSTLYLAAVMFASWRGGLGAGLLATVLSVAVATYFFLPPVYSFSLKAEGIVELIVFTLAAILTSSLSAAREQFPSLKGDEQPGKQFVPFRDGTNVCKYSPQLHPTLLNSSLSATKPEILNSF